MSWIVSLKILKYDKKCLSMILVWNKFPIFAPYFWICNLNKPK